MDIPPPPFASPAGPPASRRPHRTGALPAVALAALLAAGLGPAPQARAESLRCQGRSAEVGDSRLSVLAKCGEPQLRDQYCAPLYQPGSPYPIPQPWIGWAAPCIPVDEWLYDRGPGNLMATVRFRNGVVQSIEYGQQAR